MEGTLGEGGEKTMKYDFTIVMDRHGKDAIAVDSLGKEAKFSRFSLSYL